MKTYKAIFFDLDRTLWDFEKNTKLSIRDMYDIFGLEEKGIPDFEDFFNKYTAHNVHMWHLFKAGEITKEELKIRRFVCVLRDYGIWDNDLALKISIKYIEVSATKTLLLPNAMEILEYLHKKYPMFIITNGFEEVQHRKVKFSGLSKYFKDVITSDEAGVKKPDVRIYKYALNKTGYKAEESVMIGDEMAADILPAASIGMGQVFYNVDRLPFDGKPDHVIQDLIELKNLL